MVNYIKDDQKSQLVFLSGGIKKADSKLSAFTFIID